MFRRIGSITAALALLAGIVGGVAVAATVPGPPTLTATVDGGRVASPRVLVVNGTMTCAKNAHFHLGAWAAEADRGSLGKGSIPPKVSDKLTPKKRAAVMAHWRTLTACTGTAQPWTLSLVAVGAHPAGFAAGTAHVCIVAYASKSHLYSLFSTCADVTVG